MTVTLRPITKDNWLACIDLRPADDQVNFIAPNVFSIAESHFYPQTHIRAIYADETLVGFLMWGVDVAENPTEMWVWRFMIDRAHQGHGYGRAALTALLHDLAAAGVPAVYLSYEPNNTRAARFYANAGFELTGRVEHGEIVVRLSLSSAANLGNLED